MRFGKEHSERRETTALSINVDAVVCDLDRYRGHFRRAIVNDSESYHGQILELSRAILGGIVGYFKRCIRFEEVM